MPYAKLDGLTTYYEVLGEGEPLLVILGLGSDVASYRFFYERLATRFQVIAFDNRGAGLTSRPRSDYSIELLAHDAYRLLSLLGLGAVKLLGISMGSRIAIQLTLSHPEMVSGLVLVSALARPIRRESMSIPMRLLYLRQWIPRGRALRPQSFRTYAAQHEATIRYDGFDRLAEITAPTLICHGRRDQTVPIKHAEELAANITDARLVSFEGGHLFFRRSAEFYALVGDVGSPRDRQPGRPEV